MERWDLFVFSVWYISSSSMDCMDLSTDSFGANFDKDEHDMASETSLVQFIDAIADEKILPFLGSAFSVRCFFGTSSL